MSDEAPTWVLFEIAVTEISEVKVMKTIFAGEVVYRAD